MLVSCPVETMRLVKINGPSTSDEKRFGKEEDKKGIPLAGGQQESAPREAFFSSLDSAISAAWSAVFPN